MLEAVWRRFKVCLAWLRSQLSKQDASTSLRKKANTSIRQSTRSTDASAGWYLVSRQTPLNQAQIFIVLVVLLLTASLGQRFYNQPALSVGTEAADTFIAPYNATLPDLTTTEENRQAARNGAIKVLQIDQAQSQLLKDEANSILRQGTLLRQQSGTVPYVSSEQLSSQSQQYLRQAEEREWNEIWELIQLPQLTSEVLSQGTTGDLQVQLNSLGTRQTAVLSELARLKQRTSIESVNALRAQVDTYRRQYADAQAQLASLTTRDGVQPLDNRLFDLPESDWQQVQYSVRLVLNRMLTQGIHPGMPPDLWQRAIDTQLQGTLVIEPPADSVRNDELNKLFNERETTAKSVAATIVGAVLQPNLIEDIEQTRLRAEQVENAVKTVTVSVERGEAIVEKGEAITPGDFVLLDHFGLTQRRLNWLGLVGFGLLIVAAVAVVLGVDHWQSGGLRQRDYILILCLILSVAGFMALQVPGLGLPALGLLLGSFYGYILATVLLLLLLIILPLGGTVGLLPLTAAVAAALLGGLVAPRLRSREEFALLGGVVGITQGLVHLVLTLMFTNVAASVWYTVLRDSAVFGFYGVAWSIVALGVSPYLESVFDLVTPIRLAELANPNRPLLKRLAAEAPGTFQHTMFVANLAEAAARALGHNVELVRAGTLYHDIGKMHDPLGFIENQMGGPNKHDLINDPWASADIIKKHVTKGIEMARKHRLPKAIRAFIPEHQGDMLISYFYYKAKEIAEKDSRVTLCDDDFRYVGPIPQSPETGIVMLADSCEAALRSLHKEASPEEAYAMINKILRARWKDKQLVESCLTRKDMDTIANVFVQVWQQFNHKRIAYPKGALSTVRAN